MMGNIKEFEGHDSEMLLKKAKQLKGTDGEGHAIGLLVERLVKNNVALGDVSNSFCKCNCQGSETDCGNDVGWSDIVGTQG